jgi:hypothetical protein
MLKLTRLDKNAMYLYIEMWNAKPAWLALDEQKRGAFMEKVGAFLGSVEDPENCSVYGTCVNDGDTVPRAQYNYLVVWKLKDKSFVKPIADGTAAVGWYEYFDQVNVGGDMLDADALVGSLIKL